MTLNELITSHVRPSDVVLDVGCGDKRRSKDLVCSKIITIDAWDKTQPDILLDLEENDLPFADNSVDVTLLIDFIEHLDKERGVALIEQIKSITKRVAILLTPLWWQDNSENVHNPDLWCYNNPYDYHKSLWTVEDFKGWNRVLGLAGLENYFVGFYECMEDINV